MKYAFQSMHLSADSFYDIIDKWVRTQLYITPDEARIEGYGYTNDVAGAFATLILDWEATIFLPITDLDLAVGQYDLIRLEEVVYACRAGEKYPLLDQEVEVRVIGGTVT